MAAMQPLAIPEPGNTGYAITFRRDLSPLVRRKQPTLVRNLLIPQF